MFYWRMMDILESSLVRYGKGCFREWCELHDIQTVVDVSTDSGYVLLHEVLCFWHTIKHQPISLLP